MLSIYSEYLNRNFFILLKEEILFLISIVSKILLYKIFTFFFCNSLKN